MYESERPQPTIDLIALKNKCEHNIALGLGDILVVSSKDLLEILSILESRDHYLFRPPYDPKFGDQRICECGHPYHRHFDSYEDMIPVGCKYCVCGVFKEKT